MIIGDFNLDFKKRGLQNYQNRRIYDELIETEIAFNLLQIVEEDTWSRTYQGNIRTSLLDHIYVNNLLIVEEVKVANKLEKES